MYGNRDLIDSFYLVKLKVHEEGAKAVEIMKGDPGKGPLQRRIGRAFFKKLFYKEEPVRLFLKKKSAKKLGAVRDKA